MIEIPTAEQLANHDTCSYVDTAQMLLWETTNRMDNRSIKERIEENLLSNNEIDTIITNFQNEMDYKQDLFSCASCGMRNYSNYSERSGSNSLYTEMSLDQLQILILSDVITPDNKSQVEEYLNLGEYKQLASIL